MTAASVSSPTWGVGSAIGTAGAIFFGHFVPFVGTALVVSFPNLLYQLLLPNSWGEGIINFIVSQIVFLVGSVLCGLSWNLNSLIFFRILQGIGGGAILPVSLTLMLEAFPPSEYAMASALYGIGAVLGPAIGPTLGGYLTDTFSWPAIFFVNVPLVLLSAALTQAFIREKNAPEGVTSVDYYGLATVALWLGTMQVVLQQGQKDGWFESPFILAMSLVANAMR